MSDLLSQVRSNLEIIETITNLKELEDNKQVYFGKNGILLTQLKKLNSLPLEEKKTQGKVINELKDQLLQAYQKRREYILQQEVNKKLAAERLDLTLPPRCNQKGSIHPVTQVKKEILEIFASMGFEFRDGPEIETDYYNFTALNIPEYHPARDMHDTFYIEHGDSKKVLRTHTSSVQIRAMENSSPPFKFISMGRTFRCDYDATHTPMFHQIEGVYIDKDVNMANLKGCLAELLNKFFDGKEISIRLRPSYFPFTEPSAEVDISIGKNSSSWLEILGCGMIHPNVLRNVGIDPQKYQGFAFGIGIERITMLKYGMKDLRPFFDGDIRWSKKYGFKYFDVPSLVRGLS